MLPQMDISGFTALSSRLTAEELLDVVNSVFTAIDSAADCIGKVWKVETIGDCYKVRGVAGVAVVLTMVVVMMMT